MSITNERGTVITEADFKRLQELLQARPTRQVYGSMASSLQRELESREVVESADVPRSVVTMRSRVRIRDVRNTRPAIYTLVYPHETDIERGRISVLAPLGRALLGARVGDVVKVDTPGGVRRLQIEKVLYQPEAAGDHHL